MTVDEEKKIIEYFENIQNKVSSSLKITNPIDIY